jgi:hypothetical protein
VPAPNSETAARNGRWDFACREFAVQTGIARAVPGAVSDRRSVGTGSVIRRVKKPSSAELGRAG